MSVWDEARKLAEKLKSQARSSAVYNKLDQDKSRAGLQVFKPTSNVARTIQSVKQDPSQLWIGRELKNQFAQMKPQDVYRNTAQTFKNVARTSNKPAVKTGASFLGTMSENYSKGFQNIAEGYKNRDLARLGTGAWKVTAPSLALARGPVPAAIAGVAGGGLSYLGTKLLPNVIQGDPYENAGAGVFTGLKTRAVTSFTDPVIAKVLGNLAPQATLLARQLAKRTVGGGANVLEDEIISKLDGDQVGSGDRILSFAIGGLISGNDELLDIAKAGFKNRGFSTKEIKRVFNQIDDTIKKDYGQHRLTLPNGKSIIASGDLYANWTRNLDSNGIKYKDDYLGTQGGFADFNKTPELSEGKAKLTSDDFLLPKDVRIYDEAKAIGAKRIAPDRIAHQQLTPEKGIKALVDQQKQKLELTAKSWEKPVKEIDDLIKKYGETLPKRTQANLEKYPDLQNDYIKYINYKKYAWQPKNLSDIKTQFESRAKRLKTSWTPEQEKKALESAKKNYIELIKKDISNGYKYPDDVLNYDRSFKIAENNRARYEKGLRTSFSSDDSRIVIEDIDKIGGGMKRQDGKPITRKQIDEIKNGVADFANTMGIDVAKLAKDDRWVYAHLSGKNPFLTADAGGQYRKGANNVSISVGGTETVKKIIDGKEVYEKVNTTMAHELGHALDGKANRDLIDSDIIWSLRNKYNPIEFMPRGDKYWGSRSEITARMIEQYNAVKKGHSRIFDYEGYWPKEVYKKEIEPAVEKAIKEHFSDYKLDKPIQFKPETTIKPPDIDLAKEAQKYKSAEEFIKAQPKLYHGTFKGNDFSKFDINRAGSGVGQNKIDQGNQIYLTSDKNAGEWFARTADDNYQMQMDRTTKGGIDFKPGRGGTVLEFSIKPGAKIKELDKMPRGAEQAQKLIDNLKKQGYDLITFPDEGFKTVEGISPKMFKNGQVPKTTIVLNQDKIISKSQLIDIWNKANKPTFKAKVEPVIGYRYGKAEGQTGAGTFYNTQSGVDKVPDGQIYKYPNEIKKELSFKNPLKLDDPEVSIDGDFENAPAQFLANKWGLDTTNGKEMERAVAQEAVKRGYDGIIYGDNEIQDLKNVKVELRPTLKAKVEPIQKAKLQSQIVEQKLPEIETSQKALEVGQRSTLLPAKPLQQQFPEKIQLKTKQTASLKPTQVRQINQPLDNIIAEGRKSIGVSVPDQKKSLKEITNDLRTDWIDRYYPISQASQQAKYTLKAQNASLRPEYDPEILVRRLTGASGIADYQYQTKLKPIIEQIDSLGIPKIDLDTYLAHNRMAGFGDIGREVYGADPTKSKQIVEALEIRYPQIRQLAEQLYKYQDDSLKELADAGFLSDDAIKAMKSQNPNYAPLYRVMDEMDDYLGLPTRKTMQGASPLKKLKGSERKIDSPLENIIGNTYKYRAAIEKNRVAQSIIGLQDIIDLGFKKVGNEGYNTITVKGADGKAEFRKVLKPEFQQAKDVIFVWNNGKKEAWQVGEDIARTAKGLNEENTNALLKILQAPAQILRQGATGRNPDFMIPNVVRDQLDAAITSKYGYIPFVDYASGLKSMITNDKYYKSWANSGAKIDLGEMSGRKSIQQSFDEKTTKKKLMTWLKDALDTMGKYSEQPTRVGLYKKGLQKTGNEMLAMMESRDATVDFARMGAKMKTANSIIPFLNVNVQGFDKLVRSVKDNPGKVALNMGIYAALPAIMTTLYNLVFNKDEYNEIPQYEKNSNFVLVTGRNEDGTVNYFTIPKGNILPVVSNPIQSFIEYLFQADQQSFGELATQMLSSTLPVLSEGQSLKEVAVKTIGSNLPQAIKPITENLVNKSFYKFNPKEEESKEIVPSYMKDKLPAKQAYEFTPEMYKKIGELTNTSPLKVQNLMEGYLSGFSKIPANIIDIISDISQGEKASRNQVPALRRFLKTTYPTLETSEEEPVKKYTLSADAPQTPMAKLATYGASLISNPLETASLVVRGEPIRKVRYSGDNPLEKLLNLGDAVTVSERMNRTEQLDSGDPNTQVDHIMPKWLGGREKNSNYQILSNEDHNRKSAFEEEVLKHYEAGDIGKDEAKMLVKQFNKTLNGEKPTKKQAELWEKSASSSQFSSTSKDIDRLDYEAFEKKNPERATYYSAEKIYSEVNKLPKDDRAGRAAKLQEFRNRGYNTEEINQAIITISKLEKEGMTKTDRELLLFSPDVRAKKIIDRFEGISTKKRKQELLKLYQKYGILDEETQKAIIELGKEK